MQEELLMLGTGKTIFHTIINRLLRPCLDMDMTNNHTV